MIRFNSSTPSPRLNGLLDAARLRIEVTPEELAEARKRRSAIATALKKEFPNSRAYVNGSVAHGDALTPLTDIDQGIVVDEPGYGPGQRGPGDLMDRAAQAIRDGLKDQYEDLSVTVVGQKRAVLVRFRDPVTPGQPDFTADVIVAIDNPADEGLFIPKVPGWSRSHPEKHTAMVLAAIDDTDVAFARVVRLLKHWNRTHDKPLCSWNIKALALGCITTPTTLLAGVGTWFTYAADELAKSETEDPAGVAEKPIKLNKPQHVVVHALRDAATRLARAVELENAGYPALAEDELAKLFNDPEMMPRPNQDDVQNDEHRRVSASRKAGAITSVGSGAPLARPHVRSWAP